MNAPKARRAGARVVARVEFFASGFSCAPAAGKPAYTWGSAAIGGCRFVTAGRGIGVGRPDPHSPHKP